MDLFDKIGNVATQTYKSAANKTSKLAKEAKIKMKINECKSKISDLYQEIGELIYQKHIREENINIKEDLDEYCMQIDNLSKTIEKNRMELLKLKDKKQCKNCYAEIEIENNYCPNCGAKQKEDEVEVKDVKVIDDEESENSKNKENDTNNFNNDYKNYKSDDEIDEKINDDELEDEIEDEDKEDD